MRSYCARKLLTVMLAAGVLVAMAACGGQSAQTGILPTPQDLAAQPAGNPAPTPPMPPARSVADAIAEVQAATVPVGVEPGVFDTLKSRLVDELNKRDDGSKLVSAPPTGEANAINDLLLVSDANFHLQWTYHNVGDYNRDGLVGINDITPIGQHYQVSNSEADWDMARFADGNADGLVTVNDITPIGQHYQSFVAGYNIYGADTADGTRTQVASAALPAVQSPVPLQLSYTLESADYAYYWVVPFDGDGNEGDPSAPSTNSTDPVQIQFGSDTMLASDTFGPDGGTLTGPTGTPLEGISVEFPEGALPDPTPVSLGYNDGTVQFPLEALHSALIVLDTGDLHDFQFPAKFTMPYPSAGDIADIAIPYAVDDNGQLEPLGLGDRTEPGGVLTTGTFHDGTFIMVLVRPELLNGETGHYLTSFDPAYDAFQVYNTGSVYNPGGECAGMSSFAKWYWQNHADDSGHFYPRFMYDVGMYKGQAIIATRSFNSIAQKYSEYCNDFLGNRSMGDYYNWAVFRYTLLATAAPVLVDLGRQSDPIGDGVHSVLAYGYDDGGLWIYDPNASKDPRYIGFTTTGPASGTFTPYGGLDRIAYWGTGAIHLVESYQNILNDAETGFTDTGFAEISITSHANGEEVGTGTTHLIGNIHSGSILVDLLDVSVNQQFIELPVPENGTFGVDVPIQPGNNAFHFTTWGHSASHKPLFIPNDHPLGVFSLQGNPVPAVISVTLTWSKNDTDVDLWVIDPTGDYSNYNHKMTADGGELSIDNQAGYGPEYWSLRTDDTVRYGEAYRIRAHYYDDRGHGGVIVTAKIVQNEGTPQQQTTTKFFYLPSSDIFNNNATDTGPDWKDIAYITP